MADDFAAAIARARAMPGPLAPRLDVVAAACVIRLPGYAKAVDRMVARLTSAGAGRSAPAVGEEMPDFVLPDATGRLVRLGALIDRGPVVLAFHRGSWCDFCQLNMLALAEAEPRLTAAGATLCALAPESAGRTAAMVLEAGGRFPILSDMGLGVSSDLGLTIAIDDDLRAALEGLGVDIAEANGGAGWLLPIPATFVVDRSARIVARHVDVDPRHRMEIDAILQAVVDASA